MADISQIKAPDGTAYNLKDANSRTRLTSLEDTVVYRVLKEKTYTGIYATGDWSTTAQQQANGGFYFANVKPTDYNKHYEFRYRITVTVPGQNAYQTSSDVIIHGYQSSLNVYSVFNSIINTSYRPFYYHYYYRATNAGSTAYGHLLGIGLRSSANPTNSSYPRTIKVEILEERDCTVTFFDSALKYANVPGTGTTNYSGLSEIDAYNNGLRESGDDNDITTLRLNNEHLVAGTNKIYRYTLVLQKPDNTWESTVLNSNNASQTGKTYNNSGFVLGKVLLYNNSGSDISSGGTTGDNTIYEATNLFDARYSFNGLNSTTANSTMVAHRPFYIVGTVNASNGLFYLDSSQPWSQSLPTSEDNKVYIFIGRAWDGYRVSLHVEHPVYKYVNGGVRLYSTGALYAETAGTADSAGATKYLENQGGSTVSVGTSTWNNSQTKTALVWGQKWSQTGLTYTPSGGEATPITDTGDVSIFLTQSTTANGLNANLAVDGKVHAAQGFVGNLTGTASALSGLKLSTTSNLGIDSTDVNQKIGYVNGLTKADWNYQQSDGSLYQQTYSANWIHQIYGDYRTGQISVRGRSNGTWQAWRRVLDEGNFSNFALPLTGGTMTGGITLQTGSSGFNDKGLVWNNNAARIGASVNDLALYAKGSIYLRPNSETAISSDGIIVTTDGLFPGNQNGTETLGGVSSRWANVYSKEGNFSSTVLMSPGENFIQWQDSGNWSATNHLKEGESFPINRGGLYWTGQSDWVKLYAQETAVDELDLVLQFGDDANPRFNIQNKDGTNVTYITASGEVGAVTGTFGTSASSPRFIVQGTTYATNTYADNNPKIDFRNAGGNQNISLTFTDYDSVQNPTSLTLNGNQGNEYFIAPNIKATTKFYGNLDGTASKVTFNADNNSGQWNALLGGRSGSVYYDWAVQWMDEADATSTKSTWLMLGNNIATGTSGNKRGVLSLYNENAYRINIFPVGTHLTANRSYKLPSINSDAILVGTTGALGNAKRPVFVNASGQLAACGYNIAYSSGNSPVTTANSEGVGNSLFTISGLHNIWKHLRRNSSYSVTAYTTTATDFTPASINATAFSVDVDRLLDDDSRYVISTNALNGKTLVIDIVHMNCSYNNTLYIDFGNADWRAKSIRILTGSGTGAFTVRGTTDACGEAIYAIHSSYGGTNQNKTRFVMYNWNNASNQRVVSIGCQNYAHDVYGKPYYAGTTDMTAGSSFLATNDVYFVYE